MYTVYIYLCNEWFDTTVQRPVLSSRFWIKKENQKGKRGCVLVSVQVNVPWSRAVYRRCLDCVNLFFSLFYVYTIFFFFWAPLLIPPHPSFSAAAPPISSSCEWGWISFLLVGHYTLYTCDVYLILRYIEPDRFDLLEEVNVAPKTSLKVIPAVRFPVQQKPCPGYLYTPPVICEPLFFFFLKI
jgi:hypothetical protein